MALYSIAKYTGNGATVLYTIPFPYLAQSHVKVFVGGVLKTVTTDYTFSSATQIQFVVAPANGAAIQFERDSNRTTRLVDYQDASGVTEALMDADGNQTLYIAQEAFDFATESIGGAGNVPGPTGPDVGLPLVATGVGAFDWQALTMDNVDNKTTTRGDIVVRGASALQRLGLSSISGEVLMSNGTDPVWASPTGGFKNKIIGGNFATNPWQRGLSFATAAGYNADHWAWGVDAGTAVATVSQIAALPLMDYTEGVSTTAALEIACTTADAAPPAGGGAALYTWIEGYEAAALGFGQAGTRYVTLSFLSRHTKTGVHCVTLRNTGFTRAYVMEYNQTVSNVWQRNEITFPVCEDGTWDTTNGVGIWISFMAHCGTNFQGAAGTWHTSNILATANQVNEMDNVANRMRFAMVQLERGPVATQFEARSAAVELFLCQRYYEKGNNSLDGYAAASAPAGNSVVFQVPKRAAPTVTNDASPTLSNCTGLVADRITTREFRNYATVTALGGFAFSNNWIAKSEL